MIQEPPRVEGEQRKVQAVGVDLDPSRRPGVPKEHAPAPLPNAKFPPERMTARPSVPKHGRPNKQMPPVYGTAVPLRGVSGAIRKAAYAYPDHVARHWLMLLFADRVDVWEHRVRRYGRWAMPAFALYLAGKGLAFARDR